MTSTPGTFSDGVAVVVLGRSAPVPLGPTTSAQSLPVTVAIDQTAIAVREIDKTKSEVELSLLGIPRAETALGLFADVTTYDANPNEWQSVACSTVGTEVVLAGTANSSAFTHVPEESSAYIESNAALNSGAYAALGSKRFFRYQPGRVSGGTFGTRMTVSNDWADIKKIGVFDRFNGYYWEVQGGAQTNADAKLFNLLCVKRSNAFGSALSGINPNTTLGDVGVAGTDAVIVRDGHSWVHAAIHDQRLRVTTGGVLIIPEAGSSVRVDTAYRYVYEYRVPRLYFSHDKLDQLQDRPRFYSDSVLGSKPFRVSLNTANIGSLTVPPVTYTDGDLVPDAVADSVWNYNPSFVTMLKIEFSWYGAVGAQFLAYVPDANTAGEARWVRVHGIRASNQHSLPSLGNPFLPLQYYVQRGNQTLSRLYKYGASFYIDGGDRGSLVTRSIANAADIASIPTSSGYGTTMLGISVKNLINGIRNRMQTYPVRLGVGTSGRCVVTLVKNGTPSAAITYGTNPDNLSPIQAFLATTNSAPTITGGTVVATFQVGVGGFDLDLSPYFSPTKDYLSYPLTAAVGDFLTVCVRASSGTISASTSLTWEEQQ
jgi:hypothetical protein